MHRLHNIFQNRERPLGEVPVLVLVILGVALAAQVTWHWMRPAAMATAEELPDPPGLVTLQLLAFGEPETLSRVVMLWLQAFDHQPGLSIPFRELDYDKVIAWLQTVMSLDGRSQYPLLSASRVYAEVDDNERRRKMLEFVYDKFLEAPDQRWPWLAHGVYVAKHRIGDTDLALRFAGALRMHTSAESTPGWARQMELFILEDMGELEAARVLLGGLLESGVVKDRNELKFFEERLNKIKD